jgi:hypothetical protein
MTRRRRLSSRAVPQARRSVHWPYGLPFRAAFRAGAFAPRALAALTALVFSTFWCGGARADDAVRLEYHAPPECPSEPVFVGRVRERSLHERPAVPGELARSFVVTVSLDESGALARVDFVDPDGSAISRSVRGATCDEVVSGIALVTALAIDARATSEPAAPAPAPSAAPPPPPAPPPPRATPKATPALEQPRFGAGLGAGYVSYAGPTGALVLDVFFSAALSEHGPGARLSAFHFRADIVDAEREAQLRAYGGRLEGCPVTLSLPPFFAEPCLGTGLAALFSSGVTSENLVGDEDVQVFWDVVLIARGGVTLDDFFLIELQGEFGVPLTTPSFGFDQNPDDPAFRVPVVGGSVRAGLGIRFP